MVINMTSERGESKIRMGRELGELGARDKARQTPNPRTIARFRLEPERSRAVTIAWPHPLSHACNAVQCATEQVCDV
jgi:hypothetical protein